jgi:hypothetical protein
MTFPICCIVSFCLKTLPLNTSLFGETVFEKSRVFNLSRFKISICIWWCFVRDRTFEMAGASGHEGKFFLVLLESTVIKFVWSTGKLSFSEKSKFEGEECLLLQDEHIIVLCFYFSCWLMKCILCREWKVPLVKRRWTIGFIQDKHYDLSVLFFLVVYFSFWPWYVFAFLMARMTGAG